MIPDEGAEAVQKDDLAHNIAKASLLVAEASIPATTVSSASTAAGTAGDHLTMLSARTSAAQEVGADAPLQQAQGASQLLQTTLSLAGNSEPALPPMPMPLEPSTADLANGFQLASLTTPVVVSPPINNDSAASALTTVGVPSQLQLQLQLQQQQQLFSHTLPAASLHMPATSNPSLSSIKPIDAAASGLVSSGAPAGTGAPMLQLDTVSLLAQNNDIATAAVASSHLNTPANLQAQNQFGAELSGLAAQHASASALQSAGAQMLSPGFGAFSPTVANGLGLTPAQFPTTPATTPGTQSLQAQQQQQAMMATAIANSVDAGVSLCAAVPQPEHSQSLVATVPVVSSAVHNHSRSTSIVDGMVAMYPNDGPSNITPHSGIVSTSVTYNTAEPLIGAGLQQQLHMQYDEELTLSGALGGYAPKLPSAFSTLPQMVHQPHPQHSAAGGLSAVASTAASANQSGVPSPYATPSITAANNAAAIGHNRRLSSSFPATMPAQAPQMVSIDVAKSLGTAQQALVSTAPMGFGQLPLQALGADAFRATHHHHVHHGHSRHLSLDTANLHLMSTETPSFYGLSMQQPPHDHSVEMVNALQLETAQSLAAIQHQQHFQNLQLQMQAQAQAQMQQKGHPHAIRTVPVTPLNPYPSGSFSAMPQPAALSDSLAHAQQAQLQAQSQAHSQREAFMHHSSSSVDLGSLGSAFNVAQFNHALSGQMSPIGIHPAMSTVAGMSQLHLPQLPSQAQPPQAAANGTEPTNLDEFEVDEEEDEDEESAGKDTNGTKKIQAKAVVSKSDVSSSNSNSNSKPKKPKALYKRFRNSFIFFANERRKQWRREHPEVSKIQNRGFIQEMSKVWNTMSSEEKAPYIKMADDDKLRYEEDVKKYGPLPTSGQSSTAATPRELASTGGGNSIPTSETVSPAKGKGAVVAPVQSALIGANHPVMVPIAPARADPALSVVTTVGSALAPMLTMSATESAMMPSRDDATASGAEPDFLRSSLPVSPAVVKSNAMDVEPFEFDLGMADQSSYQALLCHTFGQDLSPTVFELDPSCYVSADTTPTEEPFSCTDPALLTAPIDSSTMQDFSGANGKTSVSSATALTSNGPPITTLVGTKRKSGSDGQPMTSLPVSIKRFRNSFIYYVNKRRRDLQFAEDGTPTNIEVNNREFLRNMSARWRAMSEEEKAPYQKMADADKERFTRQMREYEQEHPDEFGRSAKIRRRRSSAGTNISNACAEAAAKQHEKQQQQLALSAGSSAQSPVLDCEVPAAGSGLNISYCSAPSSASAALVATLTMPHRMLGSSSDITSADLHATASHIPSLPSVPEEMAVCSESMDICGDVSMAGSTASPALSLSADNAVGRAALLATLPAVPEDAHEDSNKM